MTGERDAAGAARPAEVQLLLFHAAGVALGVETAAVARVLDAGSARPPGAAGGALEELFAPLAAPARAPGKALLFKGRPSACTLEVDSLDEIVTIPTSALQPLPKPLAFFRGPRAFRGGIVRGDRVVLLVDADRLQQAAAAPGEARS